MRKLFLGLLVCASVNTFAQWHTVTGSGNMAKDTREVGDFTGIALAGNMSVQISYGKANTIIVEADDNLVPYIETMVENGTLQVKSKDRTSLKSHSRLMVYVSLTKLETLRVSGSGNIIGKGDFENGGKTDFAVSGSGNIDVGISAIKAAEISISGSGNVTIKGSGVSSIEANISGSGNIDCSELKCDDVSARVAGSGNIKVFANKSVTAHVSGSGNIYYKGDATNISLKSSGSGKIIKA